MTLSEKHTARRPGRAVLSPCPRPRPLARLAAIGVAGLCCMLWAQVGAGAQVREDFSSDPQGQGWQIFGEASLFKWNEAQQALAVTWDSSRRNSLFYLPLQTVLTMSDDFSFGFDLRLGDIQAGSTPGKSNEFEIAVGLINLDSATHSNYYRGAGQSLSYGVRNLLEIDYFPDAGFGDTLATTAVSTNNRVFPAHNFPLTLSVGDLHRFTVVYSAAERTVRTVATRNGSPFGLPPENMLGSLVLPKEADFRLDCFSVINYSDAVQAGPPSVHGSVRAHGTVDNVQLVLPAAPLRGLVLRRTSAGWAAHFE